MKKLISFLMALIAAALAANASAPVLAPPSGVLDIDLEACDVNGDGIVNISDISTWLNAARNGDFSSGRYDVNSDGIVNYIDYACLYYTITRDDTMPAEDQCDFNGNGKVDVNDWVLIFDAWKNSTNEDPYDLNYDGSVDYVDLGMMALLLAELDANASSGCYLYIEDFELKQSEVGAGTDIVVPVKAHFGAMVSAWQVFFDLPEGLRAVDADEGADLSLSYFNKNGVEYTYDVPLAHSESDYTHFISASTVAGYWQDPNGADPNAWVSYGAVKWLAGDYDEMFLLTLRPDVNFTGGDITITTDPVSNADPRGETVAPGQHITKVCHVSIEETIEQTASPVFNGYAGEYGYVVSIIPTTEESDIYYRIIKNYDVFGEWTLYTGELLFSEAGHYRVEAYAKAEGKAASDVVAFEFYTEGAPRTAQPSIYFTMYDDRAVVEADGEGTVCLYVNGNQVENPFIIPRTDQDQYYSLTATAQVEGKLISNTTYYDLIVPAREGGPSGDGISIYVKADQAPYLYSWDSSGSLCGEWPGTMLYDIETINRVDYYVYHFDEDMVNVIFNNGGGSQTGDFTHITHDAFFIYNGSDLAYGLIPPQVYGNPSGEYAFYVNTDGWDQVYAEVNGHSYPMTKVGVDGAGFEVYKWEASGLNYTPTTITFNDGAGRGVQDAYGNIYSREYVKGGYYIYSFYQTYYIVRLDMVTTIVYDDSSQRPALEDCSITLISSNDEWNGYEDIQFQISGTYFSQQARQGSVLYSIDGNEWVEFTSLLNSEQQFDETVSISFSRYNDYHSLRIIARDQSGAFSEPVYLLQAVVDASSLECENLPYVEYTGQPITFVPQVYDINHNPCYVDQDFTYSFENNVDAGLASILFQGIYPNCIGYYLITFPIHPHTISGEVHTVGEWFYYTGSAITPEVIVTDAAFGTLIEGQDYVVTYENNNQVGTGRAIVEGIGNFDGYFVLEFEIIGIPGDVNYTGTVDITDLQAMVMYIFGEYNRPFNFTAADLNEDQSVNVQDVVGEANILLNGNQLTMSSGGRRMPAIGDDTQASLYWENGVLYLYSTVPVAALDIINSVDGDIKWSLGARGMVVVNAPCDEGEHSVIYSLSDGVIPAGLTAIATATDQNATVVSAMLSDTDAELVSVKFNDSMTGLTGINSDGGVSCYMEGSDLVINSGAALRDVDVTIYSIDGRIVDNQHLSSLNSGRTKLDVSNVSDGNRYLIIVVRSGRQILATQKLTQNK